MRSLEWIVDDVVHKRSGLRAQPLIVNTVKPRFIFSMTIVRAEAERIGSDGPACCARLHDVTLICWSR